MKKENIGWLYGLIGVLIFAGSMPATRIAVAGLNPEYLTIIRAAIAGLIALFCIIAFNPQTPTKHQFKSLILVSFGVVIGFPLFTAFALQTITASRAIVFIGLLPLSTAIFAVVRANEKPKLLFWFFSILGSIIVLFFMLNNDSLHQINYGDIYMIIAIVVCGLGYAEGGKLSKEMDGWRVICWSLVIVLPIMLPLSRIYLPENFDNISHSVLFALFYVSLFSMLIGFFFWYKGLALGGIANVGQIQLIQPIVGLMLSAYFLHEQITFQMIFITSLVMICVISAKKLA